jgi:hypothetical protein
LPATANVTTHFEGYTDFIDCTDDGSSSHGLKVAEITYDMAPGAKLWLVCVSGTAGFLNAVDWLIAYDEDGDGLTPDVDVIVQSRSTYRGPHDGTSEVSQKIAAAKTAGIVWVNSAGNRAVQHWEGAFNDNGAGLHQWSGADTRLDFTVPTSRDLKFRLTWNDWGTSGGFPANNATGQEYTMNLYDSTGTVVVTANGGQSSNSFADPYIFMPYYSAAAGSYQLEIVETNAASGQFLDLFMKDNSGAIGFEYQTAGSVPIYGDSAGALTVGAVSIGAHVLQNYSGLGPTNGAGGGAPDATSRTKPDISAPTNVSVSSGSFGGTSAAAPHVGGMAALVKQRFGFSSPQVIQDWLEHHADRLGGSFVKNNQLGAGAARHCLLNNPSADDTLSDWTSFGAPAVSGGTDPHFLLDVENDHLRQDLDLSYMTADIAVGGFEFTFIGDMYADSIAGQEGFPYLYGYLFGQSGQPNRINTYLTTGRSQRQRGRVVPLRFQYHRRQINSASF